MIDQIYNVSSAYINRIKNDGKRELNAVLMLGAEPQHNIIRYIFLNTSTKFNFFFLAAVVLNFFFSCWHDLYQKCSIKWFQIS